MATTITVQKLLLERTYSPEYIAQSRAYSCVHSCKMSREHAPNKHLATAQPMDQSMLLEGEKLRLSFENLSDQSTYIIIMFVDDKRRVFSLFPCFTEFWDVMNFHHVPGGNHLVVQIDTNMLPFQKDANNSTKQQTTTTVKNFQIICCSVVKTIKQENNGHSLSFETSFEPVFQHFDFSIPVRS
ncbi:hypothetical protein C9374_005418 [Naegleria lovaniensis]|uniref:Uncharacterized protein n=1 Tax=Naegleria lovaniensis TaxID=51637 RepID=A0AA88GJN7_NAELO|nr:uncharacterized protein C9374_005418 [Naegleria lovaniensis]KAG2382216.1 hypothetical protein C9374_005418 [Naegleria lovaniensis]